MNNSSKNHLAQILWIGGATDAGKTTITQMLGQRLNCKTYHYDHHSHGYLEKKAENDEKYRNFLDVSNDARWVQPTVKTLFDFTINSFYSSFPLVLNDLHEMTNKQLIIAEGFGLLPELVFPHLAHRSQAIWLVPTDEFKWASMHRRNKPSFKDDTSDPAKATQNLFERDMMIAKEVKKQAAAQDLHLHVVDGSRSVEEVANLVEKQFLLYLTQVATMS